MDRYGNLIRESQPLTSFTPTAVHSYGNRSGWQRFNDFIGNIGDWLRDNCSALANNISIGGFFIACIAAIIGTIMVWIDEGFGSALLCGIVSAVVLYWGGLLVTGFMMILLNIPIYILGLIFHSAYSLIITIALVLGLIIYNYDNTNYNYNKTDTPTATYSTNTKQTVTNPPSTTRYRCTAKSVLNVRKAPNTSSQVLGTIKNNQVIDVYNISNGFAKIKYNGSYGYVSEKYIRKIQ